MKTDFRINIEEAAMPIGKDTYTRIYQIRVAIGPLSKDSAHQIAGVIANAINAQGFLDNPLSI